MLHLYVVGSISRANSTVSIDLLSWSRIGLAEESSSPGGASRELDMTTLFASTGRARLV